MNHPRTVRFPAVLAAVSLVVGVPVAAQDPTDLATFDEAWRIVWETHFDTTFNGLDWRKLREELRPRAVGAPRDTVRALIRDMLARLEQSHFALITADLADRPTTTAGNGTLGLEARLVGEQMLVSRLGPDGPAARAGVRMGEAVVAIAGQSVSALHQRLAEQPARSPLAARMAAAVDALLGGPAETTLTLTIADPEGRERAVTLTRAPSPGQPVKFGDLPPFQSHAEHREVATPGGRRVGVIGFNFWMVPLLRQVDSAMDRFRELDAIILDLRGNRGGVGAMTGGVAGHFIDRRDTLGLFRSRQGQLAFIVNPRRSSLDGRSVRPFSGPVAILQDELSGSASEVFAGGLQALQRVHVFGAISSGGVLPARWDRLPNGDVLYHAVADFVTSRGQVLEGRGVIPDTPVPLRREDLLAGRDAVLESALRWIDTQRSP